MPASTAKPPASTTEQPQAIAKYIPQLLTAIENDRAYMEDGFQAQVCLGWLHWHLGEPALAAGRLPKNIGHDLAQLDGPNKQSAEWTKVCALKASYLKGSALAKTGAVAEAHECFESGLPIFAVASPKHKQWKEVRNWMEVFLTAFCMLSSQAIRTRVTSPMEPESLVAFRAWDAFSESQGSSTVPGRALQTEVSRLRVWKEYYTTLSELLQQGLSFPPTQPTNTQLLHPSSKSQQRAELKHVESRYEFMLLNELQFPMADKVNQEVEAFLEIVMRNWDILCGGGWTDADLGDGGAGAVSRGVLDVLYRAATKTFHSTPILRHLFSVHLSLAEFDLAFKAFDTYMDIVKKTKERIEQTGETEPGLDDDETVLRTASECIKVLCRYGSRQGGEKAKDIGQFFEDWLNKHHPTPLQKGKSQSQAVENEDGEDQPTIISPEVFALAWRCIGISHAQWARLTFDAPSRSDIQLKAIKCFRKSLLPEYKSTTNIETLFALGTILAERRELTTAVELVRFGLLPPSSKGQSEDSGPHGGQFARERSLIPLWHLMGLLLSARQEFSMAARSCEGAFEQFKDPRTLFGAENFNHSDHLNEKPPLSHYGLVDDMDDFEKQNILEVKLTQLTLIEVLEGPEVAVNSSGELLSLYSRLFGDPSKDIIPPVASNTQPVAPPSSSAGTMRSLKGSIFGRSVRKSLPPVAHGESLISHQRSNTIQTVASQAAPAIQVTNENGREANHLRVTKNPRPEKQKGDESVPQKKSSGNMRQRAASAGLRNINVETGPKMQVVDGEAFFTPPGNPEEHSQWLDPGQRASQVGLAISPDNVSIEDSQESSSTPLSPASQQTAPKEVSPKPANSDTEKAQGNRLPNVAPYSSFTNHVTRFPRPQQKQQRAAILVKVWLLISGFYRRANMYGDARGAIEEAHKLVQSVDTEISGDNTGSLSTPKTGWGGGKSVGELWADICAEVSITPFPHLGAENNVLFSAALSQSLNRCHMPLSDTSKLLSLILPITVPVSSASLQFWRIFTTKISFRRLQYPQLLLLVLKLAP